jgi:CheY-like chemotaxis protein
MARILLVDDDPDTLQVVAHMLESGGHSVVRGTAGAAVWDALREAAFDLVVTDINMPALDGVGLARWVRQHRPGTPVIAISGYLGALSQVDGQLPFAGMLAKPLRRDALLQLVAQVSLAPPIACPS